MYKWIRPALFALDAESAHRIALRAAGTADAAGLTRLRSSYTHPSLRQDMLGMRFPNPVGIAAGLDKNAEHCRFWQFLGCGFAEVGSVTGRPSVGNARPRAFRLPADRAIVNRMGLNNEGATRVKPRLAAAHRALSMPLGINIAKTNDPSLTGQLAVDDFVFSFRTLAGSADYVTLNVSCPNTEDGKTFEEPAALDHLLSEIMSVRRGTAPDVPVLVKFSPIGFDSEVELGRLLEVALKHQVHGFVATNTTPERAGLTSRADLVAGVGPGGLSGRPLAERANRAMRMLYRITGGEALLVGVGGIDSPESAFERIASGASLIQVYTGLVYEGPGLLRRIARSLRLMVERAGFSNISEAVGSAAGRTG
jgi:dihydroorotate dehydrogenase